MVLSSRSSAGTTCLITCDKAQQGQACGQSNRYRHQRLIQKQCRCIESRHVEFMVHLFLEVLAQLLNGDILSVLGGDDNGVHTLGHSGAVDQLVLNGHLKGRKT
eukprot:TRINITY_DN6733_c0_g1_i2.p2 TRINITY_DN6733_c0_g1~~TRINITY_DN6733_c0_g1_i2.p2  ORF type:complete len:104 (-),score=5.70 TRINITY_DN6733_c0_g1_i2:684-995(-)